MVYVSLPETDDCKCPAVPEPEFLRLPRSVMVKKYCKSFIFFLWKNNPVRIKIICINLFFYENMKNIKKND